MEHLEPDIQLLIRLACALAVGMLLGLERGWRYREQPDGARVAGVRTFALISLAGALGAKLQPILGSAFAAALLIAVALIVALAHYMTSTTHKDHGATTPMACLVAFLLGAAAMLLPVSIAAGLAIVLALILSMRETIHGWTKNLSQAELTGGLLLLLISLIILPLVPNRGFGPYLALNPYKIWLMVVLVAAIGFLGYAAIKILGDRLGMLAVAALGGLSSSTAVTLALAQMVKQSPPLQIMATAAIAWAHAVMLIRLFLLVYVIAPTLALALVGPFAAGVGVASGWGAYWSLQSLRSPSAPQHYNLAPGNPLALGRALVFGLLLGGVMLLAAFLRDLFGDESLYLLAIAAGLVDVDGMAITIASLSRSELSQTTAITTLLILAIVNLGVKVAYVGFAAGRGALLNRTIAVMASMALVMIGVGWLVSL